MDRPRHFLDIASQNKDFLRAALEEAKRRKDARGRASKGAVDADAPLQGKVLALIFSKPSTRTRISFEVGMRQLGGSTLMLTGAEMQLGRGESLADTARVLSRYVDAVMIRTFSHQDAEDLAEYSDIPVINGLTDLSHPCQVMADIMTFEEKRGDIRGKKVAWVGDGNNVCASWIEAAAQFDFELVVACPPSLRPKERFLTYAADRQAKVSLTDNPREAAVGADIVTTDTWVSMGDHDTMRRHTLLKPYRVTSDLMALATPDALFMHCLPAHREEEVTTDVFDGPQSVVFDEAENRLHAQKGILLQCLA